MAATIRCRGRPIGMVDGTEIDGMTVLWCRPIALERLAAAVDADTGIVAGG